MVTGKSRVGNKWKAERERQRERSTGVREGTQERTKNGVGRKRPMERTPENLGIRRINKRQSNLL